MAVGRAWPVRLLNLCALLNPDHCLLAPAFVAQKLCPELIIVSNHFHLYSEMSSKIMNIFRRYDETMCPAGSDEAYLKYVESSLVEEMGLIIQHLVLPNIARSIA